MAEEVANDPAPAPQEKKGKKKKAAKPKKPATHPKYSEMIKQALSNLKERGGSSRQAILKYIIANFKVGNDAKIVNSHLKLALRAGVKNGTLKQSKGTGASGSFRLGEKAAAKKPAAKKAKKPAAKKAEKKKPAAKKAKAKKPAAKKAKSPKKAAAKKSPKKASKPKAKKPKSPKKASKPKGKKGAKKAAPKKK